MRIVNDKASGMPSGGSIRFLVLIFILLGALLRFSHFDLMEFKGDEVRAILLTREWLGKGIPRFGIGCGLGIPNPPGFIFALLPVVRSSTSPLVIGGYIAALNLLGIWCIYRLGRALGSPRGGAWAAGFMAAHPWLILLSRKIWSQSLLPFVVTLFLLVIARCTRHPRSRAVFWVAPLLALIWQIHYSAYSLVLFSLIWFLWVAVTRRLNWPAAAAGFFIGLLLFLPYLSYAVATDFADIKLSFAFRGGAGVSETVPWLLALEGKVAFAGGFGFPYSSAPVSLARTPLGKEKPWLQTIAMAGTVLIVSMAAAGVLFLRRERKQVSSGAGFTPWLVLLIVLPICLYVCRGIKASPNHLIISLPAVLVLAGLGVEETRAFCRDASGAIRRLAVVPTAAGAAAVICGTAVWLSFISNIEKMGGTGGDYGIAFRVQEAAAKKLIQEKVSPENIDARLTRDSSIGIFYLLDTLAGERGAYRDLKVRLIDTLRFPGRGCSPLESESAVSPPRPLKMCVYPSDEKSVQ